MNKGRWWGESNWNFMVLKIVSNRKCLFSIMLLHNPYPLLNYGSLKVTASTSSRITEVLVLWKGILVFTSILLFPGLISPWSEWMKLYIMQHFSKLGKRFPGAAVIKSQWPRLLNRISSSNELFLTLSTSQALIPLPGFEEQVGIPKTNHYVRLLIFLKASSGDCQPSK